MKSFLNIFLFVLILTSFILLQSENSFSLEVNDKDNVNSQSFDQSHSIFDSLLKKNVKNGKINYKGFISSGDRFDFYLKQLASVSGDDFSSWTRNEKLAYWINAYNAFTIKAVIDNYPIERNLDISAVIYPKNSIRQIDGVWDELKFSAAGKEVTLNEIEHEILRKEFNEPRIHTAIVCASIGCPDLMHDAYKANKIDQQLESSSSAFVNNPDKGVRVDMKKKEVHLSKIFNWFGMDFVGKYGTDEFFRGRDNKQRGVLNFVRMHINSEEKKEFLESNDFSISYIDYDWSLNELGV